MWLSPALLLLSFPGCFSDIQGPASVSGLEQGSVTVRCRYRSRWEGYTKWWCRGANWSTCRTLIQTSRSGQTKRSDRVSIRDNRQDLLFEVTMERLQQNDTDIYWCGIEKAGTDHGTRVQVTVYPAGTVTKPSVKASSSPTANRSTVVVTLGSYKRNHYMLLVFVKVPVLLILSGAILWLKWSQKVPEEQWRGSF